MNEQTLERVRCWFGEYAKRYSPQRGALHPVLEIKIEHSVRVAVDAAELARQLRWTAGDVRAARALGLLHDVGRFEQFARFRTLVDQKSVDHGEKGYEVVLKEGILKTCSARDRNAILAGIRYHNRRLVERRDPAQPPQGISGNYAQC